MDFSHSDGLEPVPVSAAVDQVGVFEVRAAAKKGLGHALHEGAHRPPARHLHFVFSRGGGQVNKAVAIQLIAAKCILMPNLEVQPRPALYALGSKVNIYGVGEVCSLVALGVVHLCLALTQS